MQDLYTAYDGPIPRDRTLRANPCVVRQMIKNQIGCIRKRDTAGWLDGGHRQHLRNLLKTYKELSNG